MDDKKYINPFDKRVINFALLFDAANDENNVDRQRDLIQSAIALSQTVNDASKAYLYYSIGTTLGEIPQTHKEETFENQLYYFRKSLSFLESEELADPIYSPHINGLIINLYVNYGNTLDSCGRKIAAIECYKKALSINPRFGMASGNLGIAYNHYARLLSNVSHRDYLHHYSYKYLCEAIKSKTPGMTHSATERYKNLVQGYDKNYREDFLEQPLNTKEFIYQNKKEQKYREWAIHNTLFLNPLNDLPISDLYIAADIIQLPPIVTPLHISTEFHNMFNQIKQEYVYSRFQYYRSLNHPETVHYADKDTYLIDAMDYSEYSIRLEVLKSSFKTLYSLLDKIAFFINHYFNLGIRDYDVSFSTIWKREKRGKNGYKYQAILSPHENFSLSSLYWISKDFYEKFLDSPNPQAERLKGIRNALEHRFTRIAMYPYSEPEIYNDKKNSVLVLTESELSLETMKLLKILREVIICLSMTVGIEENKRNSERDPSEVIMPFSLLPYEDAWKY